MSLRVRLVLLIVALVIVVALALSAFHLNSLMNSLSDDAIERGDWASQQIKTFVVDHITQHSKEYDTPSTIEETKELWNKVVSTDRDIPTVLVKMLALSPAIIEINIADSSGKILASSGAVQTRPNLAAHEEFRAWRTSRLYRRLLDLMVRRPDYQIMVPLGDVTGQSPPVFTIQVVVSSVLLRGALMPGVRAVALISGGALAASLLLTALATNWLLLPLKRIERTIDRIVQGRPDREPHSPLAKEFAAVESKLTVLGEQFRGAREEVTEKQHDLEQLIERMASQLDVASRFAAISRISGSVAHEIKNPLNAISLHLDLLRARLDAPHEELTAEIDILSKEVTRLDRVVKTFLDFSRPVEVRFEEVDLASLAREVTDLMKPQARAAHIAIEFDPATDGEPTWIRGDPDMLKQAVLNLVTNALEAMRNGGNLRLAMLRSEDSVTLEVSDDGPGIPPEVRNKVFQLYFTTKSRGSGIGLAMTYRAVQLHNGTIDFTSEDGRGTTFRLQFPAMVGHV